MARVLRTGVQAPSPPMFARTRDLMVHSFTKRPLLNVMGAQQFSYDTFGAPLQSFIGAATGVRSGAPLGYGQPPKIALQTVHLEGQAFMAGQMMFSPLSDPVG